VGGTIGYNYQLGSWVLGLEGDWDWADIKDSVACGAFTCETKNSWLATARGRIGYAFDRWLPYFTGGVAFGKVEANGSNPAATGASDTRTGWTVGGGLEYAFLGNWSAKIEYLYVDLGSFNCGTSCAVGVVSNDVDFKTNIIRAGLNYKFSGPIFRRLTSEQRNEKPRAQARGFAFLEAGSAISNGPSRSSASACRARPSSGARRRRR
jgi:outer membrane immunogenic protein